MRVAGTSSWQLEVKGSQLCELALFLRDAAGLTIEGLAGDVPSLMGAVPHLSYVLRSDARQAAGGQWRSWWLQILDLEFRDRPDDQGDARARAYQRISEYEAVCDPPAFGSLADRPALRAAAQASFASFREWESSRPRPGRDSTPVSPLDWLLIKQIADDVAFDRRVSLDAVQAKLAVLPVQGTWWRRVAPGAVLCSPAAAAEPATAQALLRDAFDSYVMRMA
jgi:hypothetical protein